jgi:DUF4097 and DUF4098 domain-containing protein YvlB
MKKISLLPLAMLIFGALGFAQNGISYSNGNNDSHGNNDWQGNNYAQYGKHYTSYSSRNSDSDSCQDQLNMESDEYPAQVRNEETVTLANQPLKVTASRNGGIRVKNWDKQEFSVKICRVAAARTESEAQQVLGKIRMGSQNGRVSVEGPEAPGNSYTWSTALLIYAPVGSTMDLTAHNGGIALNRVSANVTAHTQNGGISLRETAGKMDVEARNGGIFIKDCGGEVKANVENGGVSIELGETWNGAGLEARTHNGGLVVSIPKNFQSSLEVASAGHSSVMCQAEACEGGQRTWDDNGRIFKLGSAAPVIRASTVNGGIVIKSREHRGEI